MSLKTIAKTIPVLVILAATSSAGLAQSDACNNGGWWQRWGMGQMMMDRYQGRGPMMGQGPMMGYGWDGMLDRIDGRLAFIRTELGIRDDQSAQWDAFAAAVRTNAESRNGLMRAMMEDMSGDGYADRPLPERLAEHERHMEAQLAHIKELRTAVDALYSALDDTQKKAANDIMLPAMGMGMGMMMR